MYNWPNAAGQNYQYWNWSNNQPDINIQWNYWGTCPNCNGLYQWGNKFCPNCGHKLMLEEDDGAILEKIQKTLEDLLEEVRSLSEKVIGEVEE